MTQKSVTHLFKFLTSSLEKIVNLRGFINQ